MNWLSHWPHIHYGYALTAFGLGFLATLIIFGLFYLAALRERKEGR